MKTVATFARPSAFTASPTHVYVADTTVIKRFAFGSTAAETVVSSNMEVDNLATAGTRVFWTSGDDSAMNATVVGGTTNTPINSTTAETLAVGIALPLAIAVSGKTVFVASAGTKTAAYADGKILRLTLAE